MTVLADKLKAFILDIFLPNRCPFCGKIIMWDRYVCEDCSSAVTGANDIICRRCGQSVCVCGENIRYDRVFASFLYKEKPVKDAIYRLKVDGDTGIAVYAADDIAAHMEKENIPEPDIIIPVPMGKKKRRKRGFNQAELFAKCIGKRLDVPVDNDILYKYDTDDEQHNYGMNIRKERVKGLFGAEKIDLSGVSVMLCDDVMTTGSTLNECAGLLKELGAESVTAAVCAVTLLEKNN